MIRLILILSLVALACTVQVPSNLPTVSVTPEKLPTVKSLPTETETSVRTATVKQVAVNVRDEPDGAVIGSLKSGDRVTIVRCVGDWCKIQEPAGWVFAGCLTIETELGCEAK